MIKRKGELADYEYRKSIDHVYFTLLVKSAVTQNIKDVIFIEASAYSYIFLEFLRMNPKHQGHSKRKNALYVRVGCLRMVGKLCHVTIIPAP